MISKVHGAFILSLVTVVPANLAAETFVYSGGCFWCTEADSEKLERVSDVISGFTGGTTANPVYRVGKWGDHREAALVIYDPAVISFEELVTHVYATIDYEDRYGQFCDKGKSYRSVAFYQNRDQEKLIKNSIKEIEKRLNGKVVTLIWEFKKFYRAESYHQDYYQKNFLRYLAYKKACQREEVLNKIWN